MMMMMMMGREDRWWGCVAVGSQTWHRPLPTRHGWWSWLGEWTVRKDCAGLGVEGPLLRPAGGSPCSHLCYRRRTTDSAAEHRRWRSCMTWLHQGTERCRRSGCARCASTRQAGGTQAECRHARKSSASSRRRTASVLGPCRTVQQPGTRWRRSRGHRQRGWHEEHSPALA